jgi:hypothetical protein
LDVIPGNVYGIFLKETVTENNRAGVFYNPGKTYYVFEFMLEGTFYSRRGCRRAASASPKNAHCPSRGGEEEARENGEEREIPRLGGRFPAQTPPLPLPAHANLL